MVIRALPEILHYKIVIVTVSGSDRQDYIKEFKAFEDYNPGVPVWRGEPQYHLFRKDDQKEIITIDSSEESSGEERTPKESINLKVADRTKRRRNSSKRGKEKDVDLIDLTMSFDRLSSAESTPTKTGQSHRPSNAKAKDIFNAKSR